MISSTSHRFSVVADHAGAVVAGWKAAARVRSKPTAEALCVDYHHSYDHIHHLPCAGHEAYSCGHDQVAVVTVGVVVVADVVGAFAGVVLAHGVVVDGALGVARVEVRGEWVLGCPQSAARAYQTYSKTKRG